MQITVDLNVRAPELAGAITTLAEAIALAVGRIPALTLAPEPVAATPVAPVASAPAPAPAVEIQPDPVPEPVVEIQPDPVPEEAPELQPLPESEPEAPAPVAEAAPPAPAPTPEAPKKRASRSRAKLQVVPDHPAIALEKLDEIAKVRPLTEDEKQQCRDQVDLLIRDHKPSMPRPEEIEDMEMPEDLLDDPEAARRYMREILLSVSMRRGKDKVVLALQEVQPSAQLLGEIKDDNVLKVIQVAHSMLTEADREDAREAWATYDELTKGVLLQVGYAPTDKPLPKKPVVDPFAELRV